MGAAPLEGETTGGNCATAPELLPSSSLEAVGGDVARAWWRTPAFSARGFVLAALVPRPTCAARPAKTPAAASPATAIARVIVPIR
jgi:hypothetical protein